MLVINNFKIQRILKEIFLINSKVARCMSVFIVFMCLCTVRYHKLNEPYGYLNIVHGHVCFSTFTKSSISSIVFLLSKVPNLCNLLKARTTTEA